MINLTQFEMIKIIKNRTIISALVISVFILFGVFFIGYHYSQENMAAKNNLQNGYTAKLDKTIKEKYTGDLTDDKIELIISDYIDLFQNNLKKEKYSGPFYPFYYDIVSTFISKNNPDIYLTMFDKEKVGDRLSVSEIGIKSLDENTFKIFDKPLQLGNYVPWTELYRVTGNLYILISILVVLICSIVFSDDTLKNMNQILFTTKYGRNKSIISKLLAGIVTSTCLFLLIHVINIIVFSCMHDISGWKASIQANFAMKLYDFPVTWNHLQVYLWFIILQYIGILFIVALSLFISSLVQTPLSAFATATGLYFLPAFLIKLIERNTIFKYLYIFPINQVNLKNMLILMSSKKDFLSSTVTSNFGIIILILLVGYSFFIFLTYKHMKYWQFH